MINELEVRILPESDYALWDDFVESSPTGSIYSTTKYLQALREATGGSIEILQARMSQNILGGIALYITPHRLGPVVSPRLLLYYNGFVLAPGQTKYPSEQCSRDLGVLRVLEQALVKRRFLKIALHCHSSLQDVRVFTEAGWACKPSYSYVVSLSDLEAQNERVHKNLRRLIRKAEEAGLTFCQDDDFDSFFEMHTKTHDRKGSPLYLERSAFRKYVEDLRKHNLAALHHARLPNGRSVATQLVLLGKHRVAHTVCAAAEPEYYSTGAAAFLRWKGFEELRNSGYQGNDLTDAALNSVTHFKSQFGGTLETSFVIEMPEAWAYRTYRTCSGLYRKLFT